jgi:hypothetical protein
MSIGTFLGIERKAGNSCQIRLSLPNLFFYFAVIQKAQEKWLNQGIRRHHPPSTTLGFVDNRNLFYYHQLHSKGGKSQSRINIRLSDYRVEVSGTRFTRCIFLPNDFKLLTEVRENIVDLPSCKIVDGPDKRKRISSAGIGANIEPIGRGKKPDAIKDEGSS